MESHAVAAQVRSGDLQTADGRAEWMDTGGVKEKTNGTAAFGLNDWSLTVERAVA